MPNDVLASLWTWEVNGTVLGKLTPTMVQRLVDADDDDTVLVANPNTQTLTFNNQSVAATCEARTAALEKILQRLRDAGAVHGWRNERYPIAARFGQEPVVLVERAAVPFLGALEYGVHINGLVTTSTQKNNKHGGDGNNDATTTLMWMARRSPTKSKYPGMLDHIVAGGQPAGLSLWENCLKECQEEAGIPVHLATQGLVPVGAISYQNYCGKSDTLTRAVMFNYDLHLPADFTPTAVDGEVESFFKWTVSDLLASMPPDYPDPLKPNCYLPVIDWLLRTGHVSPDTPGYLDVLRELRSGDCQ